MAEGEESVKSVVRRLLLSVHQRRDLDVIEDLVSQDVRLETATGTVVEGRDGYRRRIRETAKRFTENEVEIDWMVAEEERVVAKTTMRTRMEGDYLDIPADSDEHELDVVFDAVVEDGRVASIRQTFDSRRLMAPAMRRGRSAVFEQLDGGVVVLDTDERIVDVNAAALAMTDSNRDDVLGESVVDAFAPLASSAEAGSGGTAETADENVGADDFETGSDDGRRVREFGDGNYVECSSTSITDGTGETVGTVIILRDVTDRRRRNQQLDVLNRVLRHNLRNDLTVIDGVVTEAINRADEELESALKTAEATVDDLLSTSETARRFQTSLERTDRYSVDLAGTCRRVVDRARERYPSATVSLSAPEAISATSTRSVEHAIWELIENGCEHGGEEPTVRLSLEEKTDTVVLTVTDDGPGIPDHEVTPLRRREETALEHGSGLGLWLVYWVVETSGGSLSFETGTDDDSGTVAKIELPCSTE